ncbi:MAG: pyridoxine 5'-phosphate synthase [Elusimicrobiota bacterium]|jgi:pyridoxine 5-phosphate synthase|nr:pyridoxine 5'-phosphate synthase [Elusimicrobiota bacterium]
MIKLGVNIDHIATLRQQRKEDFPSVIYAATVCQKAGADGITVHLREDRRHIQDKDVFELKETIKTKLNLEMAASDEIVAIALKLKPDFVCLVPEKRQELTTEGGLDVDGQRKRLSKVIEKLKKESICVSMFIDPNINQVDASAEIGADAVELHTGKYAEVFRKFGEKSEEFNFELGQIINSSNRALSKGLLLNAGHGLDYQNINRICQIPRINEFNIGFSIVARALFVGLENAVIEMKKAIAATELGGNK